MNRLSLKARTFSAALIVILIFVPLTAVTLERAFSESLQASIHDQMRVENLGLISEFELVYGEVRMPFQLFNDALNLPDSGTYGFIAMHKVPVWQSDSAVSWTAAPDLVLPAIGDEIFQLIEVDQQPYFQFSYTAVFEDMGLSFPITFHILRTTSTYQDQLHAFRYTLWLWLAGISLLLIAVLFFSLFAALQPIRVLRKQISAVETGQSDRIEGTFPVELALLTDNLNHLIQVQQQQRTRYRNSLSDLAHALKTPLAVLQGLDELPTQAHHPISQIKQQIDRQLKRAVGTKQAALQQGYPVDEACRKLVSAMQKIYHHKALTINTDINPKVRFMGDMTDFTELLGNLMDNACKAANQQVHLTLSTHQTQGLQIVIQDDGPGIDEQQREALLQRGARLDTYTEGHGIGMAIVNDLLLAYEGELDIDDSPLGGALFRIRFDQKPH